MHGYWKSVPKQRLLTMLGSRSPLNPSLLLFTDPPHCSRSESREDFGPCGLESGQLETFRAEANNSKLCQLAVLRFFLLSRSLLNSPFFFSFSRAFFSQARSNCFSMCHISAPHDLSSFSVLPLCLLCLSECLPLPLSEVLSNVFFFFCGAS